MVESGRTDSPELSAGNPLGLAFAAAGELDRISQPPANRSRSSGAAPMCHPRRALRQSAVDRQDSQTASPRVHTATTRATEEEKRGAMIVYVAYYSQIWCLAPFLSRHLFFLWKLLRMLLNRSSASEMHDYLLAQCTGRAGSRNPKRAVANLERGEASLAIRRQLTAVNL